MDAYAKAKHKGGKTSSLVTCPVGDIFWIGQESEMICSVWSKRGHFQKLPLEHIWVIVANVSP